MPTNPQQIRAGLDKDPGDMSLMFDSTASDYDRTNDVLSFGQTRRWRRAMVDAVAAQLHEKVLDVAAGTGTSSAAMAESHANVTALDLSDGMIDVGCARHPDR